MVKISKSLQSKHKESMSPWLADYVQSVAKTPLPLLPSELDKFPSRWPFPRGDLYHWIPLLNRFDNILECFVQTYGLQAGPQMRDFGCEILLQTTSHQVDFRDTRKWDAAELARLGFGQDGDSQLVLAILKFTRGLLQHCGNRSIYASSAHLSSLLNSASLHILKAALHVGHELALRYHASYKRASTTSRVFHTALLQNHYDIDLDRVQQLAQPFIKTPIAGSSIPAAPAHPFASTPASASAKGKEKAEGGPSVLATATATTATATATVSAATSQNVTTMFTNDFVAIATEGSTDPDDQNGNTSPQSWKVWGDVKVTYYPEHHPRQQEITENDSPRGQRGLVDSYASAPSTPTPLRRSSTMGSQDRTPRAERTSATSGVANSWSVPDEASSPFSPVPTRWPGGDDGAASGQRTFEIPYHAVQSCSVYELMARCPTEMPALSRYEVLSRIRTARALLDSVEQRQLALAVRLLAITNLAFIHPEIAFLEKVLKQDSEEPRRYQLTYQLAELIRPGAGKSPLPVWLQTIALQLLESLAGFSSKNADVMSAVNASVNHGVLLYVLRKAVADIKEDRPETPEEVIENDDWRKQLFSLTLHLTAGNRMPEMMTTGLMEILIDALNIRSKIAERNYLVVVTFLDTVVLSFPTSFQPFANAHGLDVISKLLVDTAASAKRIVENGDITPTNMRCSVIDYDVPFYLQQTLKWLLKFIYHLMASSFQFGPGTDRLLRNLVDNTQLLHSLRTILENMTVYGSVVWTNAATALSHFINHDPTSFVALSESGLIQSFLQAITGRPLPTVKPEAQDAGNDTTGVPGDDANGSAETSASAADATATTDAAGNAENAAAGGNPSRAADDGGNADDDDDGTGDDPDLDVPVDTEDASLGIVSREGPLSGEELERPRDHKLAGGILPSTEAIGAIPSILNSISLNNSGRRMVVDSGAFESYFEIFENPAHIRCMENEPGLPANIGSNFDELARHHPSLRTAIANAVLVMVSRVRYLADTKARTDAWGVKLSPTPPQRSVDVVNAAAASEDTEMTDASAAGNPTSESETSTPTTPAYHDAGPYVNATMLFLNAYQNNGRLQALFIQKGGIELVLDLVASPGLPINQNPPMFARSLQHSTTQLFDQSAVLGLPSLLYRTLHSFDDLSPLLNSNVGGGDTGNIGKGKAVDIGSSSESEKPNHASYFASLINPAGETPTADQVAEGTAMVKALAKTQSLLSTLQVCFPLARQGTTSFYNVNVFDYYEDLIKRLGPFLVFVMNEEEAISAAVPDRWSRKPSTSLDALNSQDGSGVAELDKLTEEEHASDAYQNYQLLRTLLSSFTPVIVQILQSMGKALLPRREREQFQRYHHLRVAEAIAGTILDPLKALDVSGPTGHKHCKVLLGALYEILVDHSRHSEHGNSSMTHIVVPVLLAVKSLGGFEILNTILRNFAQEIDRDQPESAHKLLEDPAKEPNDSPKLFLAGIGMKRILDLYSVLVSGQSIESVGLVSIFGRTGDRHYSQQATHQLVIEVRMAILPAVMDLWQSSVAEKISTTLLSKIVEILRTIAAGQMEESSFTRANKPRVSPTAVFGGDLVTFNWTVTRLPELPKIPQDLLDEACYRSNNVPEASLEYCNAHQAGLAGPRHPVPIEDTEALVKRRRAELAQRSAPQPAAGSAAASVTLSASASGTPASATPASSTPAVTAGRAPRLPFPMDPMALDSSLGLEDLFESVVGDVGLRAVGDASDPDHPLTATLTALPSLPPPILPPSPLRQQHNVSDEAGNNGSSSLTSGARTEAASSTGPDTNATVVVPSPVTDAKGDTPTSNVVVREDLEEQRTKLREDLIDRCLAVIQVHPDAVYEISELISTSVLKPAGVANGAQDVGETLTEALMSFAIDEENKKTHAQSIAAYAHLLCLLIRDVDSFFRSTVDSLRHNMDELLGFLKIPSGSSSEELPPWLPHFYLLFELLATEDEQLPTYKWTVPSLDSEKMGDPEVEVKTPILSDANYSTLLESALDILPRVGKDEVLAVSVSRLLVIMTRRREVAKTVGDKKNLQRLFLMAKQLSGMGASGFKETRIGTNIVTILRHIVEDDDVLRQVMRAEIRLFFETSPHRNLRTHDLKAFLQYLGHVALRNPKVFSSVVEEMVQIHRWPPGDNPLNYAFTVTRKQSKLDSSTLDMAATSSHDDSLGPAVQLTEDLNINDVRPSTETNGASGSNGATHGSNTDKDMPDAPKAEPTTEHKRPIVENPDGVITFLLEQLMIYQKVDDVEPNQAAKDSEKTPLGTDIPLASASSSSAAPGTEEGAAASSGAKASDSSKGKSSGDKKASRAFQSSEHPIFVFRGFLVFCLTELLHSYTRTKMEFINYKRGVALQTHTPVKPRSSVLNYLLHDVLCGAYSVPNATVVPEDTIVAKKKQAMADQARRLLVSLVEKTSERPIDRSHSRYEFDDETDLLFVRRFVLDTVLKAYKEAAVSTEPIDVRYGKMTALAELMAGMIGGDKDRTLVNHSPFSETAIAHSQMQLRRLMYEKGFLAALTASIADVDLAFPGVKRTVKQILRVLNVLTGTAIELSRLNILTHSSSPGPVEYDAISTSSLSDMEDDREETPDLYRNSSLGMLEGGEPDEFSDSEDGDQDMYEGEMDYEDEMTDEDDENVSDEDEDEMATVEHLNNEHGVVELVMEDGDDHEGHDDEDDDEDDEDEDDDEDSDEVGSEDMEGLEDHIEAIEELEDDDGASGWESETSEDDDEDEDEDDEDDDHDDYDAGAGDLHQAQIHLPDGDPNEQLEELARSMNPTFMEDEDGVRYDDPYIEDELEEDDEDEDDGMEEEEYIYEQGYPDEDGMQQDVPAGLTWDTLVIEPNHHHHNHHNHVIARHRHGGMRSPFPPFVFGSSRDGAADFGNIFRSDRTGAGSGAEEAINPLLRRAGGSPRDSSRNGHSSATFRIGMPTGGAFSAPENPIAFLNDLMASLPNLAGRGQPFHFQITHQGLRNEFRELTSPNHPDSRLGTELRSVEGRRESPVEPHQAISFRVASTGDRWVHEAKMVFGPTFNEKAESLMFHRILFILAPAAMEEARKERARLEVERQEKAKKKLEEEERRKRKEEERRQREEEEEKERKAREKEEAEEREREQAERDAEAAAAGQTGEAAVTGEADGADEAAGRDTSEPMEGVQADGDQSHVEEPATREEPEEEVPQQRIMTTIRGEEIDVTGLGIDAEYLAALPEEFREEVIASTLTARRSEARQRAESTGEQIENFNEFLDALPEDVRMEIVQQERQEQRRRQREDNRRQTSGQDEGGDNTAQEMDTASILMTFPLELREQILMEQGDELHDLLPPNLQHLAPAGDASAAVVKVERRQVVQMMDKTGVATLLRLLFVTQQGSARNSLFSLFMDLCQNRQTRLEIISTLLQVLQDGSSDMDAVERCFSQLSAKARIHARDKEAAAKMIGASGSGAAVTTTPGTAPGSTRKRQQSAMLQTRLESSPLLIMQQCLDLLVELCSKSLHIPSLFLTEHDIAGASLRKPPSSRKAKAVQSRASRFGINLLLLLLEKELVMESSSVMQLLADLLNKVTMPLQALERRRREVEAQKKAEEKAAEKAEKARIEREKKEEEEGTKAEEETGEGTASRSAAAATLVTIAAGGPEADQNKARELEPPLIPDSYMALVVNVFVARECSSKTFQNTISTIKNLSCISGTKQLFGQELTRQAKALSEKILADLETLLPHIEAAETGTEIQGIALAKFSPGAAEQNKLLRVLTALDHLFGVQAKKQEAAALGGDEAGNGAAVGPDSNDSNGSDDYMGELYRNTTFSAMWGRLSACLAAIRQRDSMLNVATILLPLIESLMVVCKNAGVGQNAGSSSSDGTTPGDEGMTVVSELSSPGARAGDENEPVRDLFFEFTEEHRRVLNELVRNNPKLMSGTFSLLVRNPKVLEFDNKRNYFNRSVHAKAGGQTHSRPSFPALQLSVRRDQVFHDSFRSLYFKTGDEMKYGKLNIRFYGEEGVDAGGVTREWFQVLARQMFDANYALFIPVSSDRTTFHPNKLSGINDEHLMFFKFIGRIIGKALYEGRLLECYFSRAVYKRILGKPVSVKDMESFDPEYYKSLVWMLENDITDVITETFSVVDDEFGVTTVKDLIDGGRDVAVTEDNKHDYVRLVVEHKLLVSVKDQMEDFLRGFHDIIPAELISIFTEQELELLISGLPDIDIDDWRSHTEYHNYNAASPQIQWFWRAVRSFDKEERAKLLQFVTGTSKVPLNGFKELEGMNGVNRFNIHRDYGNKDRLPSSHTCFNQLDLPEYDSYEIMRSQLIKAITAGNDYFGFA
ncbi:ubiquitin-protein ligase [Grosmannia clavigera kw1407]|uniref:HECT-type E3 ubiquitin transferase n=1 Tax=Grosmannia clavigera (strain kw1407 / UAMH 11150) TaxID=655863 RepID=F0XV12_GROCL|nr:ubiquitin-protein ligase [Grosmannia clavigera kw1407]EFW98561.1 ubiquitin-protein ligase [Grosmannia clavigera kw1407]